MEPGDESILSHLRRGSVEYCVLALLRDGEALGELAVAGLAAGEAAQRAAFRVAEGLRGTGFAVTLHCGGGSFKSQMKKADQSGARWALVVGENEIRQQQVAVKPLRDGTEQQTVARTDIVSHLAGRMA